MLFGQWLLQIKRQTAERKAKHYKRKHNHKPNYQFKTTNVRPLIKENSHIDASNRTTEFSLTSSKPISNEKQVLESQRETMIIQLKQDEVIKEGLKIEQNIESIRLKI